MKNFKGVIYALISSSTFGLIPLFALPLVREHGMGQPSILFYRFAISAAIMGAICVCRKESFRIDKKQLPALFVLGMLYALTALFLLYSYIYIPSGVATTIHFLYPICVSALMVIFFKEKKSIVLILAAVLSLVGVALMYWTGSGGSMSMLGVALAGATILTYAIYIVGINQSTVKTISAEMLTFFVLLCGAILFSVFALCTTGIEPIPSVGAGTRLLLLAFVPTVVSDLTLILAIKYAGSTITSILGSMEPMVAVMVGVVCFSEYFGTNSLVGMSLILLSVTLVILAGQRNKRKAKLIPIRITTNEKQ